MNNFHLYEEIGHGKFCTVYKGRKRYTIRYVAVKSIEKSRRDKVMVEVRVLSHLSHPNIVSFINWYETRNHLWIIYDYCTGGDLVHILKQDGRLPDDQVRNFGREICSGLLHVHSRSIIYADLKPGNILFNEHGALKLSGFGHAQSLSELERMLEDNTPVPRRGTPAYMAPELFQDGGVHSFASDLWSLGCVLYELSVGRPPFAAPSFQQVRETVLRDPVPPSQSLSAEHRALLLLLLRKPPLERVAWPALRLHAWWQGEAPGDDADAEALPVQPHLSELQRLSSDAAPETAEFALSDGGGSGGSANGFSPPHRAPPATATTIAATASQGRSGQAERDERPSEIAAAAQVAPLASAAVIAAVPVVEVAVPVVEAVASPILEAPPARGVASPQGGDRESGGRLEALLGAVACRRARELLVTTGLEVGVRPISRNPQIEEVEALAPVSEADLPFAPLRLGEVGAQPHAEVETFLSKVYRCIAGGPPEQKIAALSYLERVCSEPSRGPLQVADLVANSALLRLFLRMLHTRRPPSAHGGPPGLAPASPLLRTRLLSLIGQLLRHATYLEPSLASVAEPGFFEALLDAFVGEEDVGLRRRAIAAIGELLFYIAAQPSPGEGPSAWSVPDAVLDIVVQTLMSTHDDEVIQHYAAKTVENIATQQPAMALRWFFSPSLLRGLAGHVSRSTWDPFRITCLAACTHLFRAAAASGDGVATAFPEVPELVAAGLGELAPQGVPQAVQLIAAVLFIDAAAVAQAVPPSATDRLMAVLSQPRLSAQLRARTALLLSLLFVVDDLPEARVMRTALDCSFAPHLDRLGREKDRLVVQCVAASATALDVVALSLLHSLVDGLQELRAAAPPSMSQGAMVQVVAVFLHLVTSTVLCTSVLAAGMLPLLGSALELVAECGAREPFDATSDLSAPSPMLQLQALMLMLMEALGAQALLLEYAPQAASCLLPALAMFLPSPRSDVRLLALKSFSGICITFLNDSHIFDPMAEPVSETTRLLEALLCARVLPALPMLLGDEPPAPSCAFRLLATLLSRGSVAAGSAVRSLGLASHLLTALSGEQALTLHSALLIHCLLQGQEVQVCDLERAGVLDAVYGALEEAAEPAQLDFAMLDAALGVAEEAYAQQQDKADGPERATLAPEALLGDLGPLAEALPVLAGLCLPLARAKLAPLLDRAAGCCQRLAGLLGRCSVSPDRMRESAGCLPLEGVTAILETLAEVDDTLLPRGLQRRLLSVLTWVAVIEPSAEVRAEVAAGVEQLLRDKALGDDPALIGEARSLIAAAVGGSDC